MPYEHKPGTFTLFKNDKKGNEKAPDYKGDGADADGKPIKVAAWLRDGSRGKFLSCRYELADAPRPPRQEPAAAAKRADDLDDDIPF